MRVAEHSHTFEWALWLTIAGGLLTVGGTMWIILATLMERRDVERRIDSGRAVLEEGAAARTAAQGDAAMLYEVEEHLKKKLREVLGGVDWTYDALMVLPLYTRGAILDAQIRELKGPAIMILVGVVVSTAGSLVSLWVR